MTNNEIVKAFDLLLQRKEERSPLDILLNPSAVIEKAQKKPEKKKEFKYREFMDKNLGISREDMPQIDPEDISDFLLHYADKTKVKRVERKISDLKPTQAEINDDKVSKKLEEKSENWLKRKYIVSLDGYLLDGHHDWAYGLEVNPEQEVAVYRIGLPIKKLLSRTKRMNISKRLDINDNEIEKAEKVLFDSLELSANSKLLSSKILENPRNFTNELIERAKLYV